MTGSRPGSIHQRRRWELAWGSAPSLTHPVVYPTALVLILRINRLFFTISLIWRQSLWSWTRNRHIVFWAFAIESGLRLSEAPCNLSCQKPQCVPFSNRKIIKKNAQTTFSFLFLREISDRVYGATALILHAIISVICLSSIGSCVMVWNIILSIKRVYIPTSEQK